MQAQIFVLLNKMCDMKPVENNLFMSIIVNSQLVVVHHARKISNNFKRSLETD